MPFQNMENVECLFATATNENCIIMKLISYKIREMIHNIRFQSSRVLPINPKD